MKKIEVFIHYLSKNKRIITISFYILIAGILTVLLLKSWRSRDQLLPYLRQAELKQIPLVLSFYLMALVLAVSSWSEIMHSFDQTLSWWMHARIYLVTLIARRLPGTVWYIGGRMLLYKKLKVSQISTASASGVELIVSFVADGIVTAIFLPLGLGISIYWVILLIVILMCGLIILHPKSLAYIMMKLKRPLSRPLETWRVIIWLLLRIGLIISGGVMIFYTIRIFYPINNNLLFFVVGARALSGIAGLLTYFLPSSLGASDLTLLAMLSTIIPTSLSTVIALLVRIYTSLFELIFGLLFFIILKHSKEFNNILLDKQELFNSSKP